MIPRNNIPTILSLLFLLASLAASGCASFQKPTTTPPPVLAQDELFRPYTKLGVIEVSRQRFGSIEDLMGEGNEWAYEALSAEAARIGADAVIFPEIWSEKGSHLLFPSTDVKAKGVAIKFN